MKTRLIVEIETKDNYNVTYETGENPPFALIDEDGQKEWADGLHREILQIIEDRLEAEDIVESLVDSGSEYCPEDADDNSFYELKVKVEKQ